MKTISIVNFFLAFLTFQPLFSQPIGNEQVNAQLISEVNSIQPGKAFWVGVNLTISEGWHTYWKQPGDSGLATSIKWNLPEGFTASSIYWPIPKKFDIDGLVSFAYENEVLFLVEITPKKNLDLNNPITLSASIAWLACKLSCIPGEANLELILPVKETEPTINPELRTTFENARQNLPQTPSTWKIEANLDKGVYGLLIEPEDQERSIKLPKSLQFFSYNNDIKLNEPQDLHEISNGYYFLTLPLMGDVPDHLEGILVNPDGWLPDGKVHALDINIKDHKDNPITLVTKTLSSAILIKALFFAFLGGLILNLMPCVFPILGLKVMGFVKHAGESPWKTRIHGLVFTLGVLISFWILSGLLLALRASGEQLGWGFQLQSPLFITFLCLLLLLLALNFLGVFEMGLSLMSAGNKLNNQSGYTGTFSSGVLATVLSTPCTAPFMGTALGFTLTLPPSSSLAIFTALALGMAAPYLVLTFSPKLIKYLPRPGPWMESFKQAMAFPLIATVVWLLWVFGYQTHHDALTGLLFGLLLTSIAAWIYGRFATFSASPKKQFVARLISALFLLAGIALGYISAKHQPQSITNLVWEQFSQEHLQELRSEGRPIYIDFTAAWCLNCQINKKNVFSSEKVINFFKEKDVALLHADWTKRNPEITEALQSYGRSGVPTNVYYPAGKGSQPIILPEILTPNTVLEILNHP